MRDANRPSKASRRWFESVRQLADSTFHAVGSPVALSQLIRLKNRDFLGLVSCTVDPMGYDCAAKFAGDYLVAELFSKFPSWELGIARDKVALSKFADSERICLETNRRLRRAYDEWDFKTSLSPAAVIFTAASKIRWLLGDFDWSHAERFFGFGPGATFALGRKHRDPYYKFSGIPETTRECAVAGDALIKSIPGWEYHLRTVLSSDTRNDSLINIVAGNRITTVPKNAKTDRVIAIEPSLNMFLQKGIGGLIRSRLRTVGIDLNDQTPNQRRAKEGSITGAWATIDLSAASDSIAYELVRRLLPADWFAALELCRSQIGVLPSGEKIFYQKFSSMGNGYTFELESLIFWALISAVESLTGRVGSGFLVYGDDLVVPTDSAASVIEVLSYCGFSCNEKKTFVTGPFRESCGKHYFRGVDVTPFYVRKDMNVEQMLLFCNNLRRYARLSYGLDARFLSVYEEAVSMLPQKLRRPRIPDGFGDSALIGDFDECLPKRAPWGLEGFVAKVRIQVSSFVKVGGFPYLLRQLLGRRETVNPDEVVEFRESGGGNPLGSIPRDLSYEDRKVLIPQWVNFGPWLTTGT